MDANYATFTKKNYKNHFYNLKCASQVERLMNTVKSAAEKRHFFTELGRS